MAALSLAAAPATLTEKREIKKEQIIEFELRGLEPLVVHVLLQLLIFMTKQKSLQKIFEWIIISAKT